MAERASKSFHRAASGMPAAILLLVLVLLPCLYVLSCGPLARVAEWTGGDWYDAFFAPLIWLYENVPATQPWFDRYLEWWI